MVNKTVQQGRSERGGEAYSLPYVEALSDARTPLAGLFTILLCQGVMSAVSPFSSPSLSSPCSWR